MDNFVPQKLVIYIFVPLKLIMVLFVPVKLIKKILLTLNGHGIVSFDQLSVVHCRDLAKQVKLCVQNKMSVPFQMFASFSFYCWCFYNDQKPNYNPVHERDLRPVRNISVLANIETCQGYSVPVKSHL
eukprot:GFUD01037719.1.p2 GENE.GFUD01037719.1~~GFUD01037719.1.p2  ORF type:complete len:128 (+),score=11.15 GFUD01037719.1:767-1150(+)